METLVERGFHSIWGECDFDWGSTWSRNLAIGLGTNWIPGAVFVRIGGKALGRIAIRSGAKMGATKLAIKAGRAAGYTTYLGTSAAIEYGVDKSIFNSGASLGQIFVGNIGGDLIGAGLKWGVRGVVSLRKFAPSNGVRGAITGIDPSEFTLSEIGDELLKRRQALVERWRINLKFDEAIYHHEAYQTEEGVLIYLSSI